MIFLAGNSFKPGTKRYREAVKILADLNVDIHEVTIVDSNVDKFKYLLEVMRFKKRGFKFIAVGKQLANKMQKEQIPFFPLINVSEDEKKRCRQWIHRKK